MILSNKNVLITGASGGIGERLAKEFAKNKCNLFLTGRDSNKLKKISNNLGRVNYKSCDLTKSIDPLVISVREKLGHIDILVNCAGIFITKSISESSEQDFEKSFNLNVKVPFLLIKEFHKDMIDNKWGRIINIGSSSSYSGFSETSIYCSSKHALLGLSRSIYNELKNKNVRTFCFSPGSVKTDMGKQVKNQDFSTFIDPEEISKHILYTITSNSNMITEEIRFNRLSI